MEEQERIEKYLRNELPEAERAVFQQRLNEELALQQELELHRLALQAIRLEGRTALKEHFRQRHLRQPGGAKKNEAFRWRWAAALLGVVLLAVVVWWLNSRESQPSQLPQKPEPTLPEITPQHSPSQTKPSETAPKNPPAGTKKTPPNAAPPIAAEKPDPDELFAENFKPYTDEVFASNARTRAGDESPTPFEQFVEYYLKNEHEKALAVYDQIAPAVKNSDNVLFFKANSLLATGKIDEAATLLEAIIKNQRSGHVAEAKWYLALSFLKKGKVQEAEKQLSLIAADASSPRQQAAKKLLQQLSN